MGSVLDYIDCPKCGSEECSSDFYYKSGEEYLFCGECGYTRSVTLKKEARENKKYNELVESDWELKELVDPWGAYRLKEKGMIATQCGSFESIKDYKEMLSIVEKHIDDIEEFIVSRFDDGKIVKFPVVESPRIIDEMNQGPKEE
jgi:hypothetical protein